MKLDLNRLHNLSKKERFLLIFVILIIIQVILLLVLKRPVGDSPKQSEAESEIFRIAKVKREAKIKQSDAKSKQEEFLAEFEANMKDSEFLYDSKGKKDPFRSFDFSPRKVSKTGKLAELEKYSYSELKLTAIIQGFDQPKAVIEDPKGKGHTVDVGSKIGRLGGVVISITPNKVSILETSVDFNGSKNTRTVELYLR